MSIRENPVDEAKRLVFLAGERGITLRLLGGIAFGLRCPSASHTGLSRRYADIDVMAHKNQSKELTQLITKLGYATRAVFNAMQGGKRLIFNDLAHQRRIDIFLDHFEMCHRFDFSGRLEMDDMTLSLADLLATKLQIVQMNEKDLKDILCTLLDYNVVREDSKNAINGAYIAKLCSDDWGIFKTFSVNLEGLLSGTNSFELGENQRNLVLSRTGELRKLIDEAPKTLRWKIRAKIGEKMRWYELPEADTQVVDSRISRS